MQEFTVKEQLDCGVRYCDLRIAHRPNDSSTDLYFYHGVYTTLTVEVRRTAARELQILICSFPNAMQINVQRFAAS